MNRLIILAIVVGLIACEDDAQTPETPVDDMFDVNGMQVTLIKQGMLTGIGHTVEGTAKVYTDAGRKVLVFEPFSSQNGPDLRVYLSKDEDATDYVNLGLLKSTMGKQSYDIPESTDLADYHYAIIWCQKFTVLFGRAELK